MGGVMNPTELHALERIVSGRTKAHELHTLLPWNWAPSSPVIITGKAA